MLPPAMYALTRCAALSKFDRSLIEVQLLHFHQTDAVPGCVAARKDAEMNELELALEAIFRGNATTHEATSATLDFKRPQDSPKDTAPVPNSPIARNRGLASSSAAIPPLVEARAPAPLVEARGTSDRDARPRDLDRSQARASISEHPPSITNRVRVRG